MVTFCLSAQLQYRGQQTNFLWFALWGGIKKVFEGDNITLGNLYCVLLLLLLLLLFPSFMKQKRENMPSKEIFGTHYKEVEEKRPKNAPSTLSSGCVNTKRKEMRLFKEISLVYALAKTSWRQEGGTLVSLMPIRVRYMYLVITRRVVGRQAGSIDRDNHRYIFAACFSIANPYFFSLFVMLSFKPMQCWQWCDLRSTLYAACAVPW